MLRRFLASLALALAFTATQASAQSLTTYTFSTLPASPSGGDLAWITDNSGTAAVGSPAAGGAAPGNRDLVSWDATDLRWEFVTRVPSSAPIANLEPVIDSGFAGYSNTSPGVAGLALANVRGALDWLIESIGTERVCSTELVRGVGYNPTTKRYRKTCADFNWPGWRDASQATASFRVACTAEGSPHASCLRAGDVVYKGYWMRLALAAQYAEDGGQVLTLDHPYELDGAGFLQDGVTRAKFPLPYDPEWEARPEFAQLGYPTYLGGIQVARGVTIVGPGADVKLSLPGDATVTSATPKLLGGWIRDNMGPTSGGGGGTPIADGPNSNLNAPTYRVLIGWNTANSMAYCHTTSSTNPACNREASTAGDTFKYPSASEYGYASPILANYTEGSLYYLCVNDTVSGSTPANATGMCQGNRMVTCWNGGAASGRNVGGCVFDTDSDGDFSTGDAGNLNLGACESFHDSMQYDRQTRKVDLQVRLDLPQCADDASSSSDCYGVNAGSSSELLGWNAVIADVATPIGSWTGPYGQNGAACGSGGAYIETGSVAGLGGAFGPPTPRRNYYFSTGVVTPMQAVAVRRDKYDLAGAGIRGMGFMPSSWIGRNSANLGDCLSGGDDSTSNDEQACDTETQVAFGAGYNGRVEGNLFFRASHAANKSGVVETFAAAGGPNYFTRNRIRDALRVNGLSDWGEGDFSFNHVNGVNLNGGSRPLFACYSDNCRITDNYFERLKLSYGYGFFANTSNNLIARNTYRQVSVGGAQQFYFNQESGLTTIEDENFQGVFLYGAPLVRFRAMYASKQQPSLIFRRNRGTINNTSVANQSPATVVLIENETTDTTRAEQFRQVVVEQNSFITSASNGCLVWLDDDYTDANSLMEESAGKILIRGNSLTTPSGGDIYCAGGYRATPGTAFDASNDAGPSAKNFLPTIADNVLNGVRALDVPFGFRTVANVPDADTLAEGTKVKVSDGTASCGHTSGVLTSGSVRISCTAHPNGVGDDATWTAD